MLHFNLTNISRLKISGRWDLLIVRNDKEELLVDCGEKDETNIRCNLADHTFELELKKHFGLFGFKLKDRIKAKISLKKLQTLELYDGSTVFFDGFDGEQLAIKCMGAFDLRGNNSSYTNLHLEKTGAGRVDLKNSCVTNAQVMSMGVGDLMLNMNGGRLSGKVMGMGNTILSGIISENSLMSLGMSSIQHSAKL